MALWQQKVRFILTTLGVLFGSFVLTTSMSVSQGVQETIVEQYQRFGELRLIDVYPQRMAKGVTPPADLLQIKGNMSEKKKQRLQKEITIRWQQKGYSGTEFAG